MGTATHARRTGWPAALLSLAAFMAGAPAFALTGAEVLDKMEPRERGGYLAGSVGMAAMIAGAQGDTSRRDCIMEWFYEGDGVAQLNAALHRFRDREVQPVIYALIKRACGE